MRIEADSLENAIQIAAKKLNCSAIDIDFTIIQRPSGGIFGMFKKQAIIDAFNKNAKNLDLDKKAKESLEKAVKKRKNEKEQVNSKNTNLQNSQIQKTANSQISKKPKETKKTVIKTEITQNVLDEIKQKLSEWLNNSGFDMQVIEISKRSENEIYIKLDGDDNAILIGKEGLRYKAFSYMIYNWLNIKYGLNSLLEISEFLQNQTKIINEYIEKLIPKIKSGEKNSTKPFDNIFVKIAYDRLKTEFGDKNVFIKTSKQGNNKVVVNNE